MTGPPPEGWYLELDLDSGETIRPTIADTPEWTPSLRSLPEADIPIRPNDSYLTGALDRVDARVWADGQRLPLDTATISERRIGDGESVLVLTVIGGTDLQTRSALEVASRPAHTVVKDLVDGDTTLTTDVDAPAFAGVDDRVIQSADDGPALRAMFGQPAPSDPYRIDDGTDTLQPEQTAFLAVALDDFAGTADEITDSDAEQDTARDLDTITETISATVGPPDHDIPESAFYAGVRGRLGSNVSFGNPADANLNITLDGAVVGTVDANAFGSSFSWQHTPLSTGQSQGESISATLDIADAADSGTFVDTPTDDNDGVVIDAVAFYDQRATHFFDNSPDPVFVGPGPYGEVTVDSITQLTDEQIDAVTGTVTVDDTDDFVVGVAGGGAFTTASDADTVSTTLSPPSDRATLRVVLSGYGLTNTSPASNITPHSVSTAELSVDTTGTPLLSNETFDDNVIAILREIARKTGAIFEVQWNDSTGQQELNWTWPGQRSAGRTDLDASAVQIQRDSTTQTEAATVFGGRRRREIVTDSAAFGAEFRVNITATNDPLGEGSTLEIDYRLDNIGNQSGASDVELVIDGTVRDTDAGVSVGADGRATGTLTWATSQGDAGVYTALVRSADNTDSEGIQITGSATYDVSIGDISGSATGRLANDIALSLSQSDTNSPIAGGDILGVAPEVTNTDQSSPVGTVVTLRQVGGPLLDRDYVQLAGGESRAVQLAWLTNIDDTGQYLLAVEAGFARATVEVTVTDGAGFAAVDIDDVRVVEQGDVTGDAYFALAVRDTEVS